MSTTVDERVVSMRFDNRRFEENAQTSINTLGKLKQSLKFEGANKGLDEINASSKKLDFSVLGESIGAVQQKFSALQTIAIGALMRIGSTAVQVGANIAKSLAIDPMTSGLSEYETQLDSVQTVLANTKSKGTKLTDVNEALDELNVYADRTIYNFQEMTRNVGTFTAAGLDLDTSVAAIKGISNLAAISGSNSSQAATAMYQLSQALSTGTVRLMDWNSVVNAGMGGEVFQDAIKESARVHGVAVDDIIKKEGSFRDSLSEGWLTTEILMDALSKFTGDLSEEQLIQKGYTEEQAKAILELGKDANDAATKVKTFTQLMSTLKETAQSGWAQTFEIVLGDFEEAKELWTRVNDNVGGFIDSVSTWRNNLLTDALGTGWDKLMKAGIPNEEAFQKSIKAIAKTKGIKIDESKGFDAGFKKALEDGTITSDTLSKSVFNLQAQISCMTDEQLKAAGYTEEQIKTLNELVNGLRNGTISMDEFVESMKKMSGRELIIESLANIFKFLGEVLKPIKEAFHEVFDLPTAKGIYAVLEGIYNWTTKLKVTTEVANALKSTFKGIFSAIKIVWSVISGAVGIVIKLTGAIFGLSGGILDIIGYIGEYISKLREAIDKNKVFEKSASKIGNVITFLGDKLRDAVTAIKNWITNADFEPFVKAFTKIWAVIKTVAVKIYGFLSKFASTVAEAFDITDIESFFDFLKDLLTTGVLGALIKFLWDFDNSVNGNDGLVDSIKNVFTSIEDCFKEWQSSIKANVIKKIANAVLTLAISLLILSFIDTDKVVSSLMGLAGCVTALMMATKHFGKISSTFQVLGKQMGSVIAIANAILLLATALYIIAKAIAIIGGLEPERAKMGIIGIGVALAGIAVVLLALSLPLKMMPDSTKMVGMGKSLISMGAAFALASVGILIIASSLAIISKVDWTGMSDKITGMLIVFASLAMGLGVLALVDGIASKLKGTNTSFVKIGAAMVILSASLLAITTVFKIISTIKWDGMTDKIADMLTVFASLALALGVLALVDGAASKLKGANTSFIKIGAAMAILSASLLAMTTVFKIISTMKWDGMSNKIADMLTVFASLALALGVLALVDGIASKLKGANTSFIKIGAAMAILSASLLIVVGAFKAISKIKWDGMTNKIKAMMGVFAALAIATAVLCAIPKQIGNSGGKLLAAGSSIAIMSTSLLVIAAAFKVMSTINWKDMEDITESLIAVFSALVIAMGLLRIIGGEGIRFMAVGSSMAIMSTSLIAIAIALKILSTVPFSKAVTGLITIAAAMSIFVIAAKIVQSVLPTLVVFSTSLLKMGATMALVGVGIVLAAYGLEKLVSALANVLSTLLTMIPKIVDLILTFITSVITSLADNIPAIAKGIARIILGILDVLSEYIPQIADALLNIIINQLLPAIVSYTPQLVDIIMSFIISVIDGVTKNIPKLTESFARMFDELFKSISAAAKQIDKTALLSAVEAIAILLGIMTMLNMAVLLVPGSIIGALGMSGIIAILAEIADSVVKDEKALESLGNLGTLIGKFLGNFAAAFGESMANLLPVIGKKMSEFMDAVQPFFNGLKNISGDAIAKAGILALVVTMFGVAEVAAAVGNISSLGGGLARIGYEMSDFMSAVMPFFDGLNHVGTDALIKATILGGVLGVFAVAEVLATVSNIISLGGGLARIGYELSDFMTGFKTFADGLSTFDITLIDAAKTLSEMLLILTASDLLAGIVNFLTLGLGGGQSLAKLGEEMAPFGNSLAKFADAVSGIDNVEHVKMAAEACKYMAEAAKAIPNDGGLVSLFTGNNNIGKFGEDMKSFGSALVTLSNYGVNINPEMVKRVADSCVILSDAAAKIPNDGGMAGLFAGNNNIGEFGMDLMSFGLALRNISVCGLEVNPEMVKRVADSCVTLSKASSEIQNSGGLKSFFTGDNNVGKFGEDVVKFSTSLKTLSSNMEGVNIERVSSVSNAISNLASMAKKITSANLESATEAISPFGRAVKKFSGYIDDINTDTIGSKSKAIKDAINNFGKIDQSAIYKSFATTTTTISSEIDSMAQTAASKFISKGTTLSNSVKKMLSEALSAISDKRSEFYSAGGDLVDGFVDGMDNSMWKVRLKAVAMAVAALQAAREALGIASPSKEFYEIGDFGGQGLVDAFDAYGSKVYDSGYNMGETATNGLSTAISRVRNLIENGIDDQPTIRPVLDLTDVTNGVNSMNNMLDVNPSMAVMSNVGAISSSMNGRIQNGGNDDILSAIRDLGNTLGGNSGNTYNINGITYDDSSNISDAVKAIVRATKVERRK